MPRKILAKKGQNVIYDEEGECDEMYFITVGQVGVGFTTYLTPINDKPYKLTFFLGKDSYIGAHYVLHSLKSEFLYMAV
jgi:hypothetical protein